jgi:arylsulfatase A-like enzyme
VLCAAGLLVLACSEERAGSGGGSAARPDILLISIDTLRADHLASYGYERETAPTLSRLAREGARAARSWSQSSSTVPTHASLFTGLYPSQHGTYSYQQRLPGAAQTLAERLQGHGYRTFCVASSVRFRPEAGFDQGCEHYEVFDALPKNERSAAVSRSVLAQATASSPSDPRPFFGFVHYFDPHEPYAPPEPWTRRWHPGLATPAPAATSEFLQANRHPAKRLRDETLDYLRGLYDGGIGYQDAALGELLARLAEAGLAERLLVLVTSDHGEEFKEHGGLSHARTLHEELLRVPLLAHWPGRIPAGRVLERPVQTVDLHPTVLELAGVPVPEGLAGRSLAVALTHPDGEPPPVPGELEVTVHQQRADTWAVAASLERGRFKLRVDAGGEPVLFHLERDPGEQRPVGDRFPEERARLLALAAELGITRPAASALPPERAAPTDEVRERLRAIGYLDELEPD